MRQSLLTHIMRSGRRLKNCQFSCVALIFDFQIFNLLLLFYHQNPFVRYGETNLHRKPDFSNIWRKVLELSDAGASCQNTKEPFEWYSMVLQNAFLSVKMVPGAED